MQALRMWNGKCNPAKDPPVGTIQNQNNLSIRNGPANDTSSMRSVSSEDISTSDLPSACCSSNATNPAIKSGRRFQLLQVCSSHSGFEIKIATATDMSFFPRNEQHLFFYPLGKQYFVRCRSTSNGVERQKTLYFWFKSLVSNFLNIDFNVLINLHHNSKGLDPFFTRKQHVRFSVFETCFCQKHKSVDLKPKHPSFISGGKIMVFYQIAYSLNCRTSM